GPALFLFVLPVGALVVMTVIVRKVWWPTGFVLLASVAVVFLCWLEVGDNTDSRFVLPAVVTAETLLPTAFGGGPRINAAIHGLFAFGIVWILIGADAQLHASLPWYMSDWLSLHGVIGREFLAHFLVLTAVAWLTWCLVAPHGWTIAVISTLVCAAG